ncbi:CCN family member 1 [Latimeria chalumnae]|uniref:CCN family member 1 n=1 Tax=Latimeria chalumnae TaxID=7897 RepID=H3AU86_LATCH|nr:PREDICTED: protein CYR61-like [Latimeria chalumnae]|eukprot:XP_006002304.1 PREDICTED: protein CYR61-like [Latimeria chalumnae]
MEQTLLIVILSIACFSLVKSGCPTECRCPASPPQCTPGVSLVLDGCGCCKVCARQLNDDCSKTEPCDHHKGLECNFGADPWANRGICRAKLEGRTCEYNGKIYQNGENFQPNCKHQCTCIDGAVGCVPLCPMELALASPDCPKPRLVKIPSQCCERFVCDKQVKKHKGVTFDYVPYPGFHSNELIHLGKHRSMKNLAAWRPLFEERSVQKKCILQTTEWSQCSKTCGMGVSTRVTNDNPQCKLVKETRLCNIRPCGQSTFTKLKKGRKCTRTRKSKEPIRFSYAGCKSIKKYQPNYCGTCVDGRCCAPLKTRTASVRFRCDDGDTFEKNIMMIQSCKCSLDCSQLNEVVQPYYSLYNDIHKFLE